MIAKMSKYDFVLYAAQSEDFIEKLRGLGLVDITTCCSTSRVIRKLRSS